MAKLNIQLTNFWKFHFFISFMNWEKRKVQPRVTFKNLNQKLGFLNVALGWTFLFSQFMKEREKWSFQKFGNRQRFHILPNSLIYFTFDHTSVETPLSSSWLKRWKIYFWILKSDGLLNISLDCKPTQRDWKLGLLNIGKERSMNKNEWKFEFLKYVFSHFRTTYLNIYQFRRVNCEISED